MWLAESLTAEGDSGWWMLQEPGRLDMESALQTGSMLVEPTPYQSDDADEAAWLSNALGFLPGTGVVLAAAVNGKDDHRFLAHLGALLPVPPPAGISALPALESGAGHHEWANRSRATMATLSGWWHEISNRRAGAEVAASHVVDADLLSSHRCGIRSSAW